MWTSKAHAASGLERVHDSCNCACAMLEHGWPSSHACMCGPKTVHCGAAFVSGDVAAKLRCGLLFNSAEPAGPRTAAAPAVRSYLFHYSPPPFFNPRNPTTLHYLLPFVVFDIALRISTCHRHSVRATPEAIGHKIEHILSAQLLKRSIHEPAGQEFFEVDDPFEGHKLCNTNPYISLRAHRVQYIESIVCPASGEEKHSLR
jgi:hypothetical protein